MNRLAYYMSGYALKAFSGFSRARVTVHDQDRIPEGSIIYTANHFTRIETVFLPYHIHAITRKPVWSLAAASLFKGALKGVLAAMGAVSTKDPHRDHLMVKSLLSREAECIIFPEGLMVKNKKVVVDEGFAVFQDGAVQRPHTGAAVLALQTEFYRERLRRMKTINPDEFNRLIAHFEMDSPETVLSGETFIVPVNITYYPVRAKENMLSWFAQNMMAHPSERVMDELMTEGTMILSGVDVDIRFGSAIALKPFLFDGFVESDVTSRRPVQFSPRLSSAHVMRERALQVMHQYMSRVYAMTTLNYDHIFASILRYLPDEMSSVSAYHFRCRAFLATAACRMSLHCHFHRSLYENQIHLLMDDRFNRYEDFMRLAFETGVIAMEGDTIRRDPARLKRPSSFHTVRVDNPVFVIANEVEPLTDLQHYLKSLSTKTDQEIERQVLDHLLASQSQSFADDLARSGAGDALLYNGPGRPILMEEKNGEKGVLLIHDYLCSPGEMRDLARHFHHLGFSVYVPRLKGHGTTFEDLAVCDYRQWLEAAEEGLVIMRHLCRRFAVGGVGVGGLIAMHLAARTREADAVFAVAPPFRVRDYAASFSAPAGLWAKVLGRARGDGPGAKTANGFIPPRTAVSYGHNPEAGMKQVDRLITHVEAGLKQLAVPVMVSQSRNNPLVDPRGSEKLFERIPSTTKEFYLFEMDIHGLPVQGMDSRTVRRVFGAVSGFIETMMST